MVRHIDRFIAAMRREEADELLFATGEPVRVRTGEQMRVVLAQAVRSDQILAIAVEFAPPGLTAGLTVDGETCFEFEAPGGPISARFCRWHDQLEVALREHPAAVAAETVAPPPPDAPAAGVPPPKVSAPATADGSIAPAPKAAGPRIDGLLRALIALGASDLHLTAGMQPRVRVDGDMRRMPGTDGETLGGDEIHATPTSRTRSRSWRASG
jgi:Tfp pilus assembly ATPase PilU